VSGHSRGLPRHDRDAVRRAYLAFKSGARLRSEDVERLLRAAGVELSRNRLNELGRDSDRAHPITAVELWALISAWAAEQRATDAAPAQT
jgi:hypothetical protein